MKKDAKKILASFHYPEGVMKICEKLQKKGFQCFIVGGAIRDILLSGWNFYPSISFTDASFRKVDIDPREYLKIPDFDLATDATPDQIQKMFQESFYDNKYGTVKIKYDDKEKKTTSIYEVTTFRAELGYTKRRFPKVKFSKSLFKDLSRRDFTIDAMAFDPIANRFIDQYHGIKDLFKKTIRTVKDPNDRFSEDALRLLKAVRLSAKTGFAIEEKTKKAMKKNRKLLSEISSERIRIELLKIVAGDYAITGMLTALELDILPHIIPELSKSVGVTQNKHHAYTCFFHSIASMQFCPSDDPNVRLAALLHDIGKPATKKGEGENATFYKHPEVGAEMTKKILSRLRFPKKDIEKISNLVKHHLFYYDFDVVTDAGVRRFIKRVGKENLKDLFDLRIGDRLGSCTQVAKPKRLTELEKRITEVQKDPIDTRMLKVDGNDVMKILGVKPGKTVGQILNMLLEEALDNPETNRRQRQQKRIKEIYTTMTRNKNC